MKLQDLTGQTFGRLLVVQRIEDHYYPNGRHDVQYICRCVCGNEINALGIHLRSGHTKSCGCFRKDTTGRMKKTHGMTNTRLHNIWKNMKSRCTCSSNDDYHLYGGRGITVCKEWEGDFHTFANWAIYNGYSDGLSLDRQDVNKGYCPENCRWVTQKAQCNNTRRNINIDFNGETHTLKEWAEILHINYGTLQSRIARGWSYERALSTNKANTR